VIAVVDAGVAIRWFLFFKPDEAQDDLLDSTLIPQLNAPIGAGLPAIATVAFRGQARSYGKKAQR